nr:plexin-D1-like [Columba livia]
MCLQGAGALLKINLDSAMKVISRRSISVAYGEPVHPVMQFDPSDPTYLYLMTSYQMTRVKVAACDQYSTCTECLAAADAYCGWCTMETRCSLQHECSNFTGANFWASVSEGVQQCPSMTILEPEINIDKENPALIIQINGTIPNLNGTNISCDYGNNIHTVARVAGDDVNQFIYCSLLPREKYPSFPDDQDHVVVEAALRVNSKNIIRANFTIYDCKRMGNIYPKRACTSCLSTRWKCHWCPSTYTCVSNHSQCADALQMEKKIDCPRIVPASLDPMPTGVSRDITISLANATFSKETALECHFGTDRSFEARWVNSSAVECIHVLLHTSEKSHLFPVNLQLKDRPDRFIDSPEMMTVEVYNCATGSADCSQCLGREDLGHRCVWSESSSSCRLHGEGTPLSDVCPAPEIRKIEPLRGPLEGGTLLTIRGRNLGRPPRPADTSSPRIVCRTGEALEAFSDVVTVNVSREGRSRERYSYVLPVVQSIAPLNGPKAGGTRVTIRGSRLDVGSELRVLVNGSRQCTDLRWDTLG